MSQSDAVREFYERTPYPPALSSLDERRGALGDRKHRRAQFHLVWPTEPFRDSCKILVAGCGTSQAARYALREPRSRVTGIDVSETSLRCTRALQQKYDLKNLDLHQLPIERVAELEQSFDLVVCTGVLHHLPDPDEGLRALRDVLTPGGAMRLMVYARYGRAGIYMMQEYCRLLGVFASNRELQDLDATLGMLSPEHPITSVLRKAKDFRSPDAMADALLHPLDRAYSVPEVYAWLERCGMSFGRWIEQAPYSAQCGVVAKGPHAARLARLPLRQQHAAVELLRGTMVSHAFIAYRDAAPFGFTQERWQAYVPLSQPHTVCVRERLPPGIAAVLIHRAHRFTDLLCTVAPSEEPLLGAIDGERDLAEIVQGFGGDEAEALSFFERLWLHDQVVFDASRAT